MDYKYHAINNVGKKESGRIVADGESTAKAAIKNRGLYLVSLKETDAKRGGRWGGFVSWGTSQRLPVQLARQLSSLLRGGVPLFQALTIISNQVDGQREKEIVGSLRDAVKGGAPFSDALKVYPNIFDNLFVYSVAAGEKTGALDSILRYQADLLESRATVKAKIKAALIYPAVMSLVGLGVLIFLLTFVVPTVTKIFDRLNQQLPLITRILVTTTSLVKSYAPAFVVIMAVFVITAVLWVTRSPKGRRFWDGLVLRFPVSGALYQMILVGRFAKILGTLLKSSVHMLQSLVVVSSTMKNTIAADAVMEMSRMVERGADLSIALRETRIFPPYVADMVSVGESSGNIEEMLNSVSEYYESNASQKIAALTSLIEPLIIVALGAVVAVIMLSILLPLFEMNNVLSKG